MDDHDRKILQWIAATICEQHAKFDNECGVCKLNLHALELAFNYGRDHILPAAVTMRLLHEVDDLD